MSKGTKLWKKAKRLIPGGTGLFSKVSELYLPDQWPSYFKKAKGVELWDLDGKKYIDMSYMGIGACILGYADPDVNRAVKKVIDEGSMATLNSPEEVELAELFLKMHPWASMVRYARSGGEAMAIAVRIARAHTKKDKAAFCGYHGWHDWYLAANLADKKNLDGQILPGLKPLGVPRALKGTALPFNYNRIKELEKIVKQNRGQIGVIVMEPEREHGPENNFLQKVRRIANEIGAVLIFDEITSGFRMNIGGVHELYKVRPDIAVYGKAISNGYPMAVIVGKKNVMSAAEESFISSTYWTERVGPVATLATLKKIKERNVPRHLINIGKLVTAGWKKVAEKHGLRIRTFGLPPLTHFSFDYGKDNQALHTLFNQEMLARGFLAKNAFYASFAHKETHVKQYIKATNEVFRIIKEALKKGDVKKRLKGPVVHTGFKRLT